VTAVLLCHGIYGYEHRLGTGLDPWKAHTTHAAPMDTHHTPSDEDGGNTGHRAMVAGGYFTVLVSVLLGVFLWSWHGSSKTWSVRGAFRFATRPFTPLVTHPPRGPTLYLFQVIRL
jgi:hypothetical protein